jgi:hypothetical protein
MFIYKIPVAEHRMELSRYMSNCGKEQEQDMMKKSWKVVEQPLQLGKREAEIKNLFSQR